MLIYFLENHYDEADLSERQAFLSMLALPDPALYDILTGAETCPDKATVEVVERINEYSRN